MPCAPRSPRVRATVCFCPTGLHDGELAGDPDAGTLARLSEIRGDLLLAFGTLDPHTPDAGRALIAERLAALGKRPPSLYEADMPLCATRGPVHSNVPIKR